MEKNSIELTKEDYEIVNAWVEKYRNTIKNCEICDAKDWQVMNKVFIDFSVKKAKFTGAVSAFPHLIVVCEECGNAKMIGAIKAGLKNIPIEQMGSADD